jgi:phospholipid/cholesterol/gamma-HCH transport system ATP-binding protein
MSAEPVIRVRGLTKRFDGADVLRRVDLDVEAGETLVVLGRSGSGKSVLLKHLNGLLQPDEGSVTYRGAELVGRRESELVGVRRHVGMLFQGGALFDSLDVGDNVAFALDEQRTCVEPDRSLRVARLLEMVGLPGTERRMPAELSGGMRKRAALARTLAIEPDVMLYDEPTTGLDPVTARQISLLIRDLQRRLGLSSVVVTHDLASAYNVGDRIAFLHDGRFLCTGSTNEVRNTADPIVRGFLDANSLESEARA